MLATLKTFSIQFWNQEKYPGDSVITGHGTVNGKTVYIFSQGRML
jgi:acetyl-CoA carboxylase carboxyltransferase component